MDTYMQMMTEFLNTATPEEWMFVGVDSDYDEPEVLSLLNWMVRQAHCPKAVAQAIYWYAGPLIFTRYTSSTVPENQRVYFDLVSIIEEKFLADFYRETDIGFNPSEDWTDGRPMAENWTLGDMDELLHIPEELVIPTQGRSLTRDDLPPGFREGMPEYVWNAVREQL